jgi:hypothetical protein
MPSVPAFLIIDYASRHGAEKLGRFVARAAEIARTNKTPLRILLLDRSLNTADRRARGGWWDAFRNELQTRDPVANKNIMKPLELHSLGDADLLSIIRGRLDAEKRERFGDEYLLAKLEELDVRKRPLFAAVLGEFLTEDDDETLDLTKAFDGLFQREEEQFWFRGVPDEHRDTLRNAIALSTFCRGLDRDRFLEEAAAKRGLFDKDVLDKSATFSSLMTRAVPPRSSEHHFGFLEPDILGEWYVVSTLRAIENAPDRSALADLAWSLGGSGPPEFIVRCFQDFPDETQELNYFLPGSRAAEERGIELVRAILYLHDHIREVLSASDEAQTAEGLKAHFDRTLALIELLTKHPGASSSLKENVFSALRVATKILTTRVNPSGVSEGSFDASSPRAAVAVLPTRRLLSVFGKASVRPQSRVGAQFSERN